MTYPNNNGSNANKKRTVLVVDDEADIREIVRTMIGEKYPYAQVIESTNGAEAFNKINRQFFDLLILDVKMPKVDGVGLMRSLATLKPEQRPRSVIVLSGHVSGGDLPVELAGVTYLAKPIDASQFHGKVHRALYPEEFAKPAPAKVDVAFVHPFIEAALTVLETTANTKARKENVFVRASDQISGDISAIVAMNSEQYLGSMAISFDTQAFLGVIEGMLGEKFEAITPDIQDACGELCNQIFGIAKRVLNEQGHTIQPAIPSVVVGAGHRIKHSANGPCIAVKFATDAGHFTIEAVLQPRVAGTESSEAAA